MLADAIAFAAEAHRVQKDKRGDPYILHPLRMVLTLRINHYSEVHQVAAALHDVVEDTEVTLGEIHGRFGRLVGDAVDALTQRGKEPYSDFLLRAGDETYKEYIKRCCQNPIARIVKRFDVYDNADPRRHMPEVPVGRYVWTLEYLDELEQRELIRARASTEYHS